jgi:hypothetical protein
MAEIGKKGSITKLNDSNYHLWKFKMQILLRCDDVWDSVILLKPASDKLPANCHGNIWLCSRRQPTPLMLTSVCEMLLKLQSIHECSSMCSKFYLIRKLYSMRFTLGTMTAHITAMLETVNQLRGFGKNLLTKMW